MRICVQVLAGGTIPGTSASRLWQGSQFTFQNVLPYYTNLRETFNYYTEPCLISTKQSETSPQSRRLEIYNVPETSIKYSIFQKINKLN